MAQVEWTLKELVLLQDLCKEHASIDIIHGRLRPKSRQEIRSKIQSLGLPVPKSQRVVVWSEADINLLLEWCRQGFSIPEITQLFNGKYSQNAIVGKRRKLGVRTNTQYQRPEHDLDEEESVAQPDPLQVDPTRPKWMCSWRENGIYVCKGTNQPGRDYCAEHCTQNFFVQKQEREKRERLEKVLADAR